MTLLEILLHELETWPEGKEYAYQSFTTSMAYFVSPIEVDQGFKTINLCQISTERGPDHKVTRQEWQTAKIKSLPFFHSVASILGEERAVKELLAVDEINCNVKDLDGAFAFADTPQGFDFWKNIAVPSREANKLRHALNTITAAMDLEHYIKLQSDGSGSVRDHADNEIIYFANPDYLVREYLNPPPKFEHWALIQDRFKWIAKDNNEIWWAYEDKPTLTDRYWRSDGDFRSMGILKVEIPCHWSQSLIKRPSHS